MQTTSINLRHLYRDPLSENEYEEVSTELQCLAHAQGKADGMANRPVQLVEYKSIANVVHTTIQNKLNEFALSTQNISGVLVSKKIEQTAKQKQHLLQAGITQDQVKLEVLDKQKERVCPNPKKALRRKLVTAFLALLAISDGLLNFPAFRNSFPFYTALIIAASVAAGVFLSIPLVAGYLLKAQNRNEFRLKTGLFLSAYFIVFYLLGNLRLHAANIPTLDSLDPSEVSVQASSPSCVTLWAVILVSFGLCVISLFTAMKYHKSIQESREEDEYEKKKKQADILRHSIQSRQSEINQIQADSLAAQTKALQAYEYACAHQQRLIDCGATAFSTYCQTNLNHRSDGNIPEFLLTPPFHEYKAVFQHTGN